MSMIEVIRAIRDNSTFLLTGHLSPDGDSIGCQLALAEALEQLGKEVSLQSADPVPAMYRRLPGAGRVRRVAEVEGEYDVAVLLECPTLPRSGFEKVPAAVLVNIDHHPDNHEFADINWVNDKASAAAVMIYTLVVEMGCEVTSSMAENLFAAVMTDTGSFTYANTTARALEIAAELIKSGAKPEAVAQKVYRSYPPEKLDLIGTLLSGMRRYQGGEVALLSLDHAEIEKRGYSKEIFEDIVNMPLTASTVKISILAREDEADVWRFSMRSKGDIDVGEVAGEMGGGGHRNAAGFTARGSLDNLVDSVIEKLKAFLEADKEVLTDL
jgi:phosphoesterase RecJ-like protein